MGYLSTSDQFIVGICSAGGGGGFFLACKGFLENVRQFIPRLRFFFFLFLSGD